VSESAREPPDVSNLRRQAPAAFARLIADHERIVLGLGQSLGLSGADLDDAAAEVFADVYRALPTFQERSELSTWVYRIAYRTILRIRHQYRKRPALDLPPDDVDPRQGRPDEIVGHDEMNAILWKVVASLEPRQAMAVELHYRRGWSVDRIAVVMECPNGTVKTLLSRARDRLRMVFERKGVRP
jgi:RNA polymerase sigma-70 factor (ECF subfamily)